MRYTLDATMSWFKPLAASVLAQVVILLTITLFERLWPAGAKGPAGAQPPAGPQQPDGADRAADSRRPAGPQPPAGPRHPAGRRRNLGIGAIGLATLSLAGAWLAPLSTWAVNAAGGGIFVLPSSGWGLAAGIAIYVCAMDLGEYLFHRAQHALPWMWAMHSLHHSDPHFNSTTTVRHFWLDSWMKGATIWLAVGVLFKASSVVLGAYGVLSYYNFLAHADVRLSFKGASWMLNSPAYHRLHHSAAP
jgi:hypothetical protein